MGCSIRFGLCCIFRKAPIHFRQTTAAGLARRAPRCRRRLIAEICLANAASLRQALEFCSANGIGSFRVTSRILPLKTHPRFGYDVAELPRGRSIIAAFKACGRYARIHGLRTTFHPDQFVVLNSPDPHVLRSSLAELAYQAEVAGWIGADVICVHGGGAYGDKAAALAWLRTSIRALPPPVRRRLALENDERLFTVRDLLPVCRATRVPLVYDVHHHRCNPDGLSETAAARLALATWNREPLFHVSTPRRGKGGRRLSFHADYIEPADIPPLWRRLRVTVEVEAKAKELAVLRLKRALGCRASSEDRKVSSPPATHRRRDPVGSGQN